MQRRSIVGKDRNSGGLSQIKVYFDEDSSAVKYTITSGNVAADMHFHTFCNIILEEVSTEEFSRVSVAEQNGENSSISFQLSATVFCIRAFD